MLTIRLLSVCVLVLSLCLQAFGFFGSQKFKLRSLYPLWWLRISRFLHRCKISFNFQLRCLKEKTIIVSNDEFFGKFFPSFLISIRSVCLIRKYQITFFKKYIHADTSSEFWLYIVQEYFNGDTRHNKKQRKQHHCIKDILARESFDFIKAEKTNVIH